MRSYKKFINNKRIVIVGPAPSIIGTNQRDLIESYDIVVRLNHALLVPKNLRSDIGSRTDILYSTTKIPKSLHPDINLIAKTAKWVVCPYARVSPFNRYITKFENLNNGKIPFVCAYSPKQYHEIVNNVGTRPTIGLAAIIHLLSYDIKELYVTGLTFYKKTPGNSGGYYDEYRNKDDYKGKATEEEVIKLVNKIGVHNIDKHIKYMKLLQIDSRLKCDKPLMKVLSEST